MEGSKEKPVVFSLQYVIDTDKIYNYGIEIFGKNQAQKYESLIDKITTELSVCYWMYPECRYLPTKSRLYRNVILESHLIIYRVKTERIEVLRVIHSQSSISRIRSVRNIKIS
ncbi:MAG: type II toxin-antitoxin system RelE/ParE family toxin [Bacteroidota bacterium]|nr:type II toxin-antitoxin system RelE/ParE family toxin [Bacteroidota bacterium]